MANPTRNPTNRSGQLLSVPTNQEGGQPRLVTEDEGLPTQKIETSLSITAIDEDDVSEGTYQAVISLSNKQSSVIQYSITAGTSNSIELQFWGSIYDDADAETEDDWINVTSSFINSDDLIITEDSTKGLIFLDTDIPFSQLKFIYVVTATTADNSIKVGWRG
jgi:hypothetical protein